jgi:hypothetical protein
VIVIENLFIMPFGKKQSKQSKQPKQPKQTSDEQTSQPKGFLMRFFPKPSTSTQTSSSSSDDENHMKPELNLFKPKSQNFVENPVFDDEDEEFYNVPIYNEYDNCDFPPATRPPATHIYVQPAKANESDTDEVDYSQALPAPTVEEVPFSPAKTFEHVEKREPAPQPPQKVDVKTQTTTTDEKVDVKTPTTDEKEKVQPTKIVINYHINITLPQVVPTQSTQTTHTTPVVPTQSTQTTHTTPVVPTTQKTTTLDDFQRFVVDIHRKPSLNEVLIGLIIVAGLYVEKAMKGDGGSFWRDYYSGYLAGNLWKSCDFLSKINMSQRVPEHWVLRGIVQSTEMTIYDFVQTVLCQMNKHTVSHQHLHLEVLDFAENLEKMIKDPNCEGFTTCSCVYMVHRTLWRTIRVGECHGTTHSSLNNCVYHKKNVDSGILKCYCSKHTPQNVPQYTHRNIPQYKPTQHSPFCYCNGSLIF